MAKKAPEPVHVLRGHTSDVQALAFLPDGRLLAGCADALRAGRFVSRACSALARPSTTAGA